MEAIERSPSDATRAGATPPDCPACGHPGPMRTGELLDEGAFRQCPGCGLEFVRPLPRGVPTFPDFSAYGRDLLDRISTSGGAEEALLATERIVLGALRGSLGAGARVLELCAESGRFLAAARAAGFEVSAADPLPSHCAVLRDHGIPAATGMLEAVPAEWRAPDAVVLLESLVRFPEPGVLLEGIRRRFPNARVHVVVPSPRQSLKLPEFAQRLAYPPDHLTRWSRSSLQAVLHRAGYRARVQRLQAGVDFPTRRGRYGNLVALAVRLLNEGEVALYGTGVPAA